MLKSLLKYIYVFKRTLKRLAQVIIDKLDKKKKQWKPLIFLVYYPIKPEIWLQTKSKSTNLKQSLYTKKH